MTTYRFRPYPEYKPSGVDWLGDVPSHWSISALRHLGTKIGSGLTPRGGATTYVNDGVLFLRSQNVHFDGLRLEEVAHISEQVDAEMANSRVRANDVLLNITGASIGRCCVVPQLIDRANVNQHVCIIRPLMSRVEPKYLCNHLRSNSVQFLIQQVSSGAAREGLTLDDMKAFPVPLPPLDEQRAIINQAVTKGLDPDAPMKPSGIDWLGDIPAHWEIDRLKRKVGFQEGPGIMAADFRDGSIPLLRISCLRGPDATLEGCNFLDSEMVMQSWKHFRIRASDYLISASGNTGAISRANARVAGAIPYTGIMRLWPQSSAVNMEFVRLFIRSDLFKIQVMVAKSGVAIEHYGPSHLNRMWIIMPTIQEQGTIVKSVEQASRQLDEAASRHEREIGLIQEYRTRLISDVVTGKLDVRGVEPGNMALSSTGSTPKILLVSNRVAKGES